MKLKVVSLMFYSASVISWVFWRINKCWSTKKKINLIICWHLKLFHLLPAINDYFKAHITVLPMYHSYSLSLCWIFFHIFLLPFNCCHHLTAGNVQSQSNGSVLFSLPKWPNIPSWHAELTDRKMACNNTLTENVPNWCSNVMNKHQQILRTVFFFYACHVKEL